MKPMDWLVRIASDRWLSIANYRTAATVLHLAAMVFLNSLTTFSLWAFIGIWAVQHLLVDHTTLSQTYVTMAIIGIATSWVGGYLSDRQSPRLVFVASRVIAAVTAIVATLVDSVPFVGLGLITIIAGINGLIGPIEQRLVPDLFPDELHERAFAAVGVARQFGLVTAPMLGGLLLLGGWDSLLIGNAVLGLICALTARKVVPDTLATGVRAAPSPIRVLLQDWRFVLFFVGTCMAMIPYFSYETILPIFLTETRDVAASTWGLLASIPPFLIISLQMLIVRVTSSVSLPPQTGDGIFAHGLTTFSLVRTVCTCNNRACYFLICYWHHVISS